MSTITYTYTMGVDTPYSELDEWQRSAYQWTVTLSHGGETVRVPYFMGSALCEDPDPRNVLECIVTDRTFADYTFAEYCAETGADEDSRRALAQWDAIRDATDSYRAFFATFDGDLDGDPEEWDLTFEEEE